MTLLSPGVSSASVVDTDKERAFKKNRMDKDDTHVRLVSESPRASDYVKLHAISN